jgi:hypothetical protein
MSGNDVEVRFGAVADGSLDSVTGKAAEAILEVPKAAKDAQAQVASAFDGMSSSARSAAEEIQAQTLQMNLGFQRLRETLENLPSGATRAAAGIANVSHSGTNNRAIMESLVLVHEAMSGRFTRLAGSSLILTQALAGEEAIAGAVALALSPVGLAVIAVTGVTVAGAAIAYQYAEAQAAVTRAVVGVGAASGVSAEQLNKLAEAGAAGFKSSVGENREALEAFTGAGVRNKTTLAELTGVTADFAALTGQKAAPAVAELAKAMADPAKGAQDLNEKFSFLDATQLRQIQTMAQLGDKMGAQAELAHLLAQRTDEAAKAAGGLQNWFHTLLTGASDLGNEIGKLITHLGDLAQAENRGYGDPTAGAKARVAAAQRTAQLKQDSAGGADLEAATPEAQAQAQKTQLQGDVNTVSKALAADTQLHGAHSAEVKRDSEALVEYTRALNTYMSPAQKAHEIALLDVQIANNKNAAIRAQLATQREQIELSGQVMSAAEAQQKAADAGELKGAKAPKGKDDDVARWRADLQEKLADSQNWFADEASVTAQFWQNILNTEKLSATQRRQVQTDLNAARKTLARQAFEDQIAGDREAITAAQGNWEAQLTGWAKTLSDIGAKQGIQSKLYQATLKDELTAVQEHVRQVNEALTQGYQRKAGTEENTAEAQGTVGGLKLQSQEGAVRNAAQLGQINPQQELTQLTVIKAQEFALESQTAQKVLDAKLTALRAEMAEYGKTPEQIAEIQAQITQAQTESDNAQLVAAQRFENEKVNLAREAAMQQAQAYRQNVNTIVSTMNNGFLGMARGTTTFQATMTRVAESIENIWVSKFSSIVTDFVTGQSKQTAVAVAGQNTQTAAVAAGTAQRTAAQQAGAAQSLLLNFQATEKTILNNAAAAASAAYQAMAGIPVIGPALGAGAAALAFTAVEAYGNLASASGGYDIGNENPLTQLHAHEMVLPASIAQPLRAQIANGSMSGDGGGGGGGTTNINHNWSVSALDARSVKGLLNSSRGRAMVNSFTRGK